MHQFVELKRFGDEVRCPPFDCIHGILHRAVAGDDDADDSGITLEGSFNDASSIDTRHPKISDHDVEGELFEQVNRLFAAIRLDDLETALSQTFRHERAQCRLVVYEEKMKHGANILTHGGAKGRNRGWYCGVSAYESGVYDG